MTACRCTHEQGDTDCEKHPHCNNCGESVESMRLVVDYRAVEKSLDSANVPWFVVEGTTATLAERIATLVRDRDEARNLLAVTAMNLEREKRKYEAEKGLADRHVERNIAALKALGITYPGLCTDKVWGGGIVEGIEELQRQLVEAKHELANEKQVAADLTAQRDQQTKNLEGYARIVNRQDRELDEHGERVMTAVGRLVCIYHLYGGHTVDNRGVRGCVWDAVELLAPHVSKAIEASDWDDAYAKFWDGDGRTLEGSATSVEPPSTTPIDEMLTNLVGIFHGMKIAPTDPLNLELTLGLFFDHVHALALVTQDTRARLMKLERKEQP